MLKLNRKLGLSRRYYAMYLIRDRKAEKETYNRQRKRINRELRNNSYRLSEYKHDLSYRYRARYRNVTRR
jgi:hypothetical protein